MNSLTLPRRRRGRQSASDQQQYQSALRLWCDQLKQIASSLEFRVSSRGWCYILEQHGLGKGDFDRAQDLINDCRKTGLLPLDFAADDGAREFDHIERLDQSVEYEVDSWMWTLQTAHQDYTPFSFWDDQPVYLQLLVEKVDLKSLFGPICHRYRIPVANAKGWSDLNQRADLMRRFQHASARGQQPVLLYCGDFDPAGLLITDSLKKNLTDLSGAMNWSPDRIIIDRFGLNRDFIDAHDLSWIDGLETGGGMDLSDAAHRHHDRAYVQDYIRQHGARKVEANVLVTQPEAGRRLFLDAIGKYLPLSAPETFESKLTDARESLRLALAQRLRGDAA